MIFDGIAASLLVVAVIAGWRGGFVGRLGAWIGFAAGGLVTARWIQQGIDAVNLEGEHQRLAVAAIAVLLGAFVGHAIGWRGARGLRGLVPRPFRWIDSLVGVIVATGSVALFVWILLPPLAATNGWPNQQAKNSRVVELVEKYSPVAPSVTGLLGQLLNEWPNIPGFESASGPLDVGDPPVEISVAGEVLEVAAASIARVSAVACSQRQDGTAFVVAPNLLLTNAHVVAGSLDVEVAVSSKALQPATVTAFDPERDLALLRIETSLPSLALQSPLAGQLAAVIGHPAGGPLRTSPIRLVERVTANGRDLYDSMDTQRKIWFAAAKLQSGDSGAPVIDTNGDVLGIIFAVAPPATPEYERAAYVLDRAEIAAFMAEVAAFEDRSVVNTGQCLK